MEKELQKKSLDRFFRSEYQKLVGFTRKNLDERFFEASPEDIVQDVMLGLMDRFDLDAQISNMAGYIYRSVLNRITDSRKKKRRAVSLESFSESREGNFLLSTLASEPPDETGGFPALASESLQQAILQLRPDEQALILATEFDHQTYEELSEEWDIPVGTLLSRKHRALSKLYRILSNNQT
jgi:RNA polymerase sigma factor (sigma-70 family)